MPKHNPIYTERFDQVLTQLVKEFGEGNWAEITRQMKTIYEFHIPNKAMVQARWRAINPKINRNIFNDEDDYRNWHICLKHKCHWDAVREEYIQLGQVRDKCYLSQRFYYVFTYKLVDLNKGLGIMPHSNMRQIETLRDTTKKRAIELHDQSLTTIKDAQTKEMILNCRTLVKILTYMVDNYKLDFKSVLTQVRQIITNRKFQMVVQNLFTLDKLVRISFNEIRPIEDELEISTTDNKKSDPKRPTIVRRWDDALSQPSSDEVSENEEILKKSMKISKNIQQSHYSRYDLQQIKLTELYQVCINDQNMQFYDWYNEAKISKAKNKQDLVVELFEAMQLDENAKKKKTDTSNKLRKRVNYQMKQIEKKKDMIIKQYNENQEDKIKTVRGRIKIDKELFPGCYTKFFDKEDQDDYSDDGNLSVVDIDQIYNFNMQAIKPRKKIRTTKIEQD